MLAACHALRYGMNSLRQTCEWAHRDRIAAQMDSIVAVVRQIQIVGPAAAAAVAAVVVVMLADGVTSADVVTESVVVTAGALQATELTPQMIATPLTMH